MANVLDLRRRIRSVKSTRQITKAMKMIAAAKLRRAQERAVSARPYAKDAGQRDRLADAAYRPVRSGDRRRASSAAAGARREAGAADRGFTEIRVLPAALTATSPRPPSVSSDEKGEELDRDCMRSVAKGAIFFAAASGARGVHR